MRNYTEKTDKSDCLENNTETGREAHVALSSKGKMTKDTLGKETGLSHHKGKVFLIENTAKQGGARAVRPKRNTGALRPSKCHRVLKGRDPCLSVGSLPPPHPPGTWGSHWLDPWEGKEGFGKPEWPESRAGGEDTG